MSNPPPTTSAAWSAVEKSFHAICAGQGTLNTLGELIRGLAEVGLSSLIAPVLASAKASGPAWENQREAILRDAAKLRSSQLGWEHFEETFRGNLAALLPANPSLAGLADFWREHQGRYELHRAMDGNFQIVDRQAPGFLAGLLGGVKDHRSITHRWTYERKGFQAIRPITFDGAGYGWLLLRVLESTHETFLNYSCALYVLEPDAASICMLLNLHDLRRWERRLRVFVGADAVELMQRAQAARPLWLIPVATICDRLRPRPALNTQPALTAVVEERQNRAQRVKEEIGAHYDRLTPADWAGRYTAALSGGEPLRVLGITSRFTTVLQYSMDELGAAVGAAGHEFILAKEPDDQSLESGELELIAEHKPDLLVQISRMRYENPSLPRNLPFLCWDQDALPCMRTEEAGKSLDWLTYVAGSGALFGHEHLNWPRENCILTGLAGATHRYHNGPVAKDLFDKHRCTFSYTSNAAGEPQTLVAQLRANYAANTAVQRRFDDLAAQVLSHVQAGGTWNAAQVADLIGGDIPVAVKHEMVSNLRRISDRAFRHVALGWVADYCRRNQLTLRLYGKGWEASPAFAEFAAGFLAPGEEMRALYQASDVNLQIIETGFIHSRALDGLAAGGFFLYRYAPEVRCTDGQGEARVAMARRALETGCVTFGQLDASKDPVIAPQWAFCRTVIPLGRAQDRCRMLDFWLAAPPEEIQIPFLDEITFAGREEFAAMADRFLKDEALRREVAGQFRRLVAERFSYDARLREFLFGISSGLRHAAGRMAPAQAA